jgi:hypothetical protein
MQYWILLRGVLLKGRILLRMVLLKGRILLRGVLLKGRILLRGVLLKGRILLRMVLLKGRILLRGILLKGRLKSIRHHPFFFSFLAKNIQCAESLSLQSVQLICTTTSDFHAEVG